MKIKQIYHIGLPCNDLERATKFYTDVLGMKCTKVGFDTESGGPYKDEFHLPSLMHDPSRLESGDQQQSVRCHQRCRPKSEFE